MRKISLLFIIICFVMLSCDSKINTSENALSVLIDSVQHKYVPDKRDNVYEIEAVGGKDYITLKGYTSVREAKTELIELISKETSSFVDSIIILPDKSVGNKVYGVVNVSVADLRTQPKYSAEMATQLLLGAPVEVLQYNDWVRIKSAEGYVAWTTEYSFVPMTKSEFNSWIMAKKIIFADIYGFAYEAANESGQTVSDLVFGNMLKLEGEVGKFYKVSYPDGRNGYVLKSQSQPFDKWLSSIDLTEQSILQKAQSLKGIPYTWGGTSPKMMDCSGFTKTVMLMHGIILMRDASQQVNTGISVDISAGYDNLHPGDLMFFGKKGQGGNKDRIRHVGFYMGNGEFIHASGYVRVSSLDSTKANYDEVNTREFISASRIIGAVGTKGIWPVNENPLYKEQP